jgi:hypothetical protein
MLQLTMLTFLTPKTAAKKSPCNNLDTNQWVCNEREMRTNTISPTSLFESHSFHRHAVTAGYLNRL